MLSAATTAILCNPLATGFSHCLGRRLHMKIIRSARSTRLCGCRMRCAASPSGCVRKKGVNLQVRVGANVGDVVVRSIQTGEKQAEYTPIGHSISLTSRLQMLANPGSIAISDGLRKLVEGFFTLKALGPARVKGSSDLVNVYEVLGLGPLRTLAARGRAWADEVCRARARDLGDAPCGDL